MKKMVGIFSLSILFLVTGCSSDTQNNSAGTSSSSQTSNSIESTQGVSDSSQGENETETGHIAIIYYSLTGTTETVAQEIQTQTNGDLFALQTVEAYPENYSAVADLVQQQQADEEFPELQPLEVDLSAYETIFIGSPIWFGSSSLPLQQWLMQNDLSGKTVCPFFTSGSSGIASAMTEIENLISPQTLMPGLGITDETVAETPQLVASWLAEN
ncbi:flavodoxin [Enterococcus sp. LJL120]